MEVNEIKQETPHAWAKITKSSSKDGGIGFEYGYSDPTGDTGNVAKQLQYLKNGIERLLADQG